MVLNHRYKVYKVERTGLKAEKSKFVDAPIIVGSPVVVKQIVFYDRSSRLVGVSNT